MDKDEWESRSHDEPLHSDLREVADLLMVAPLSANTLGKFSTGIADNLISSIFRAWDIYGKPCIVAPAMNTLMYESPITQDQLRFLQETLKVKVLPTVEKKLMCGDIGKGGMLGVPEITEIVKTTL